MRLPFKETLMTAGCVAILCGLGAWQVQRLEWKNALVQRLEAAYATQGKEIGLTAESLTTLAVQQNPLGYGSVEGVFLRDKALLLGPKTQGGKAGYHLIIPLETQDNQTLLVNAGWVSELWKDTFEDRMAFLPHNRVFLKGLIRKADWSSFTSKNSPANDLWFRGDVSEIAKAKALEHVYPFMLYAESAVPDLQDVTLHEKGWLPRNKHFEYALFWFSMAGVMLGVYGFYVASLNKKKAP